MVVWGWQKEETPERRQGPGRDVSRLDDGCSFVSWGHLLSPTSSPSFHGSVSSGAPKPRGEISLTCCLAGVQAAGIGVPLLHPWWLHRRSESQKRGRWESTSTNSVSSAPFMFSLPSSPHAALTKNPPALLGCPSDSVGSLSLQLGRGLEVFLALRKI